MESLPIIHVYGFSSSDQPLHDIRERCAITMKCHPEELGEIVQFDCNNLQDAIIDLTRHSTNTLSVAETATETDCSHYDKICFGHVVRDVSPKKLMICLSFKLPQSVVTSNNK